jgi:hypothetical protein
VTGVTKFLFFVNANSDFEANAVYRYAYMPVMAVTANRFQISKAVHVKAF